MLRQADPDAIWAAPGADKKALLAGSGTATAPGRSCPAARASCSSTAPSPGSSPTASLRLLGDLGIVARLKVGRTAKCTVDTYWLCISGADQIERALWLLPPAERAEVGRATGAQSKRIAPTGYRRLTREGAWPGCGSCRRAPAVRRHRVLASRCPSVTPSSRRTGW